MTDTSFNRPVQLPTRGRRAAPARAGRDCRARQVGVHDGNLAASRARRGDIVAHMLVSGNYGFFRDELYYLADGRHLQAGYVDQPALLGWLAAFLRVTVGNGLVAIHVIPALAGAAIVVVAGVMARELGGGRVAQLVAGAAALFCADLMARRPSSPWTCWINSGGRSRVFCLRVRSLGAPLGPNAAADLTGGGARRLWLAFGLVAAMGFLTNLGNAFLLPCGGPCAPRHAPITGICARRGRGWRRQSPQQASCPTWSGTRSMVGQPWTSIASTAISPRGRWIFLSTSYFPDEPDCHTSCRSRRGLLLSPRRAGATESWGGPSSWST